MRFHLVAERFYKLNPKKLERYLPFLEEERNEFVGDIHLTGWVYGQYIASSIGANLSKRAKYPAQPYYINDHSTDDEETYVMTDAERFEAFANVFNSRNTTADPAGKQEDIVDAEYTEIKSDAPDGENDA